MGNIFGISDILNAVFNRDAKKLKVETGLQIDSVTATDVTIHDAVATDNKLKVNEDGSVPVELTGSIATTIHDAVATDNKLKVNEDGSVPVELTGSFVRKSTDPFPEGKEGDSLYLWDTKQVFLHDGTTWREL